MSNPWYARYSGDYLKDTLELSLIEHGAYILLLDHYYSSSAPLNTNVSILYRVCRAFEPDEQSAVNKVLNKFFKLEDDGWHNSRADREILKAREVSEARRAAVESRWGKNPEGSRKSRMKEAKERATHTKSEWVALMATLGNECAKCGASAFDVALEKDHVIPICKGGHDGIGNIQPLCAECNSGRSQEIEDHRPAAMTRIAARNHTNVLQKHAQPQPQSHILQQKQHAGEVDQVGDKKATGQEMRFMECFDDHEADLKRVFPHADYEAEKLKCIAHYAKAPSVGPDPWPTVSKWFGRIPKPTTRQTLPDVRMENYEAAREFCNDAR